MSESEHRQQELQETLGVEQQARLRLEEELRQATQTRSVLETKLEMERSLSELTRRNRQTKEKKIRLRLEEELRQARVTCAELERRLENERLLRETSRQDVQTKEETVREQSQLLQQERELKSSLEERVSDLQIHVEEERSWRIATERELSEEIITLQKDREKLEKEREIYQQRIRDGERTVSESEHRQRELQETLGVEQQARLRLEEESRQATQTRAVLETKLEIELSSRELFRRNLQEKEETIRFRLEEELRQARVTCAELERRLENERLLRETSRQDVQTKEETVREQSQLLQQERELKSSLEERVRDLQIHVEEERSWRIATERELTEEIIILQQDRENLEREREVYQQGIRDRERTVSESEQRLREWQSALNADQEALAEYRCPRDPREPRDWIIGRDEVILSEKSLGVGAWGKVYEGTFRGCQVADKQIHDLILSPHNNRLFEREMSIASRCRHPHLLQFIGATNDDGSPLFITELLDTDLRNVLSQRALHHEEVVCIALDVAKGLNYLHLNKPFPIIHRDISSSNVLLWRRDNWWRAKLSDYGAANFMRQYMTSNPGASIYAAPESQTTRQSPKVSTNYNTFQLPSLPGNIYLLTLIYLVILINVQTD